MALIGTRKVLGKENDFFMFGFMVENIKEIKYHQNFSKFDIFLNLLVVI